jgi:hypothetical protein
MATKKAAVKPAKKETSMVKWSEKFAKYAHSTKEQIKTLGGAGLGVKFGHGTITVGDRTITSGKLQVVILGFCAHNRWFEGEYDPSMAVPPDCYAFATDFGDREMGPPPAVENPHAEKCYGCEYNVWGSGRGNSKACQNTARLGLLLADDLEDGAATAKAEMATATVSPTNLQYFKKYLLELAEDNGDCPIWGAVTEIQAFDDAKTQIRLEFKLVELIEDDDILTALEKRFLKIQDLLQVPYSMTAAAKKESNGNGAVKRQRKFTPVAKAPVAKAKAKARK